MDKKKAQRLIRRAAREGRIVYASTDRIERLGALPGEFVRRVFGITGALITDESQLSDFVTFDPTERPDALQDMCIRILEMYGVSVEPHDYIVDVLERLR